MHSIHQSVYHKVLRVAVAVVAVVLIFESGLLSESTRSLSTHTHQYMANAVGMTASIEPTQLNTLTAELTEQKLALADREAAVSAREIEVGIIEQSGQRIDYGTYVTAGILFILLVLIVLNYALDFLHRRENMVVTVARG